MYDLLTTTYWESDVFEECDAFLQSLNWNHPGCVIAEVSPLDLHPWYLLEKLKDRFVDFPVIYVSENPSIEMAVEAMKNGASDFLAKDAPNQRLIQAIKDAVKENRKKIDISVRMTKFRNELKKLTHTERLVLEVLCQKSSYKEVAAFLGLTPKTISAHCLHIRKKLKARNMTQAVRFLLLSGWDTKGR